jgi:nucleotide-binding universal stress UspA family protein
MNDNERILMSTIVVGFVLTGEGKVALDWAISEAKRSDARLVVIHSARGGDHDKDEDVIAYREAGERIEQRLRDEGISNFRLAGLVLGNKPAEDIVDVAKSEGADLIVIGVRRRSSLGKLILGSNAQAIIMEAPCPVVTVRVSDPVA